MCQQRIWIGSKGLPHSFLLCRIKTLIEKFNNETTTPEEELQLLKELNGQVDNLKDFMDDLHEEKKIESIRSKIKESF